jgi:hypothetical protein
LANEEKKLKLKINDVDGRRRVNLKLDFYFGRKDELNGKLGQGTKGDTNLRD